MSSAFYPLGMKSYNNHVPQGGYKSWKGSGVFSNPVGLTAGTVRPLTNNDPANQFQTGFGLPRPIKHARKGKGFNYVVSLPDQNNPETYVNVTMNRGVKSSSMGTMVKQMIDNPGSYSVSKNTLNETNNMINMDNDCGQCRGIGIVASYYPNTLYLTENPEPNTTNPPLCCNAERKARRRVLPASTMLKKNYYTTNTQYLENRCQTFQQRSFNFQSNRPVGIVPEEFAKPGSALATFNTYYANCQPNGEIYQSSQIALITQMLDVMVSQDILTQTQATTFLELQVYTLQGFYDYLVYLNIPEAFVVFTAFMNNPYYGVPIEGPSNPKGCKMVVYKPNNPQFAQQGAVSSSTKILKTNVDTIQTNIASIRNVPTNFLKNKAPTCGQQINSRIHFQNKKSCYLSPQYNLNTIPYQPAFP
jgi:hypothetical protein